MSEKLDKLRQERDKAERHLRKATNRIRKHLAIIFAPKKDAGETPAPFIIILIILMDPLSINPFSLPVTFPAGISQPYTDQPISSGTHILPWTQPHS